MEINFNNHTQQIKEQTSIQEFLNTLGEAKQKGIAVAVNDKVVPKTKWDQYVFKHNDSVLVIRATQGG